jgi:hypothetical protein
MCEQQSSTLVLRHLVEVEPVPQIGCKAIPVLTSLLRGTGELDEPTARLSSLADMGEEHVRRGSHTRGAAVKLCAAKQDATLDLVSETRKRVDHLADREPRRPELGGDLLDVCGCRLGVPEHG